VSDRTLKILILALVVVAALWGLASLLGGPSSGGGAEGSGEMAELLEGVSGETVSRVRFMGPDDTITLRRESPEWRVNGFRADSATLARFWDELEEASVGDLMAANPENHARMGVSADSARVLEMELEGQTRTLLVGNQGPRFGTAFVRLPDADEVFLLRGNIRPSLTRSLDDWRNKRMAAVDTARVQTIRVQRQEESYTLIRTDTVWSLADGGEEADAPTVRTLLGQLARLQATGFQEPQDTLPDRAVSLTALDAPGDTLLHLELGGGEGERWARVTGDSILYRFPSWRVSQVAPPRADLTGDSS
jgi:hypothetical protein